MACCSNLETVFTGCAPRQSAAQYLQGGGVFCSPHSPTAKPKLRLLYECAPLAFVVEAAGGASRDGTASVLDRRIETSADRSVICLGSGVEVTKSVVALGAGGMWN